ncbi:MAG: hypothetical protein M3144_03505 [Actinomycetota bacterium]|nr:hypothetical protein [Actinomycetota bacterium]
MPRQVAAKERWRPWRSKELIAGLGDSEHLEGLDHVRPVLPHPGQEHAAKVVGHAPSVACGDNLLDEQRNSAAAPVDRGRHLGRRGRARDSRDLLGHLVRGQRLERHPQHRPSFEHVGEPGQLRLGDRALIAQGGDQPPPADLGLGDEVGQGVPRRLVRPVQILHDRTSGDGPTRLARLAPRASKSSDRVAACPLTSIRTTGSVSGMTGRKAATRGV